MQETSIKAVDDSSWEMARSCPECGLYFSSIKAVRQHMARKHGVKAKAIEGVQYRAEQHSIGGMPHCRHCGAKFSSMGVLRTRIITDACGWLHRTSHITEHELTVQERGETEIRETNDTAPLRPQLAQVGTTATSTAKPSHDGDQTETTTNALHTTTMVTNQTPHANPSHMISSAQRPNSLTEHSSGVNHHTDAQPRQYTLSQGQPTAPPASLFADQTIRTLAVSPSNLLRIAEDQSNRLKHHCLICDHWVVDLNTVKTHILRTHPIAWHKCNPTIGQSHGVFAKSLKRDSPCIYCGKTVFGVARHLTQCPVIMQVAFLHQLVTLDVDPHDDQSDLADIDAKQAEKLLTDYEEARQSTQVQGLLHKCFLCHADIYDIQTWRRHMKQKHSQQWHKLEGLLKSAALAQPLPRPCPYCKTQYQKTPAVHVGKCLALQQLLAIQASPQGLLDNGRRIHGSGSANPSTLGEPKPYGPRTGEKGAEEREWKRGEPRDKEPPTAEAVDPTAAGRGDGRGASAGSTSRINEYCVANVGAPRARNTDVGSGPQLRAAPDHEGVLNSPAAISRQPGVEGETRRGHMRLTAAHSTHDMHTSRTPGKTKEGGSRPSSHAEPASRVANDRPEMAVSGMASTGPQADADNPDSYPASGHHENSAGAHPGSGQAELRTPLPLNPTAQGELPNGVSDHAPHAINEAGNSQAAHTLHGDGGSVSHATHRHADQERTQQAQQNGRGASQTTTKTLMHYFKKGAASGPRAADTGPKGRASTGQNETEVAASPGSAPCLQEAHSKTPAVTNKQGSSGIGGVGEAPPETETAEDGKRYCSAEGQADKQRSATCIALNGSTGISQVQAHVLQTSMLNRRNQCYANALITCLYSVSQEAGSHIGSIQSAITETARHPEADIFTRQEWEPLFRGWRRPTQQHDVTELLHHFAPHMQGPAMQGEWAVHRPIPCQPLRLLDVSPTQPYVSMHMGTNGNMQDIVNSWSRDHKCLLVSAPRILLISLVRFAYQSNQTRKLRQPVRVNRRIWICTRGEAENSAPGERYGASHAFPFPVHLQQYELIGGIIHIGDLAHTGHYRAFTALHDSHPNDELNRSNFLMHDDNSPPQKARQSNIAQIASNVYVLAYRQGSSS